MHTYRKAEGSGWQVGSVAFGSFQPLGPLFGTECEAAAFASFLNGGRYNPYEIEAVFAVQPTPEEDDDSIHPDRPAALEDYPVKRAHK